MTIKFLNTDCTEAIVTRGVFQRRQAHVARIVELNASGDPVQRYDLWNWVFVASGRKVADSDYGVAERLTHERVTTLARSRSEEDWVPVYVTPQARLVERKS